ncbi:DUF3422 family protein [Pseudoalteromonas sp. GB56]
MSQQNTASIEFRYATQKEYHYTQVNKHARFEYHYAELHARPFSRSKVPLRISQLCFLHDEHSCAARELTHLARICERYGINPPKAGASCFYQRLGDFEIRYERHTEFSSYSFILHDVEAQPFAHPPIALVPADWLQQISGQVISAVHIEALAEGAINLERENLRQCFEGHRLIGSQLHQGEASVYTALRLHSDEFNRILVVNKSLNDCQSGRVLRALLEVEAYRNMTLLAFPLAQEVSAKVSDMESKLADLLKSQHDVRTGEQDKHLLSQLSHMAGEVARLIADSRYRFDAATAYYQMVISRLNELEEQEINDLQTLCAFIERRLSPANRTVIAAQRRLDDLASRVDRASEFLRTRVDMAIEVQNQALLKSMERRARLQFNLQQTVEGLSVVVMTYYVLQLSEYVLQAANDLGTSVNKTLIIVLLMPIIFTLTWLLNRRIRKKFNRMK